mgnify:CR=1 FL=1
MDEKKICNLADRMWIRGKMILGNVRERVQDYINDDAGMGTVEIILIIVVLVGLVIIFKNQITDIVNDLFDSITSKANTVTR